MFSAVLFMAKVSGSNDDGVAKTHQLLRCRHCSRCFGVRKYALLLDNCAPCIWRFLLSHPIIGFLAKASNDVFGQFFFPAERDSVPEPFVTEVDREFDGGVGQPDGGRKMSLAGQQINEGCGDRRCQNPPGNSLRHTAAGCLHDASPVDRMAAWDHPDRTSMSLWNKGYFNKVKLSRKNIKFLQLK
jgi:hypothetical protein